MIEYLINTVFTQNELDYLATRRRNLVNIRSLAETLLDIRRFKAFNRCERIVLGVTGEAPRANRRAEQVYRPL